MCRGGNNASRSARYLNGQLSSLWENAIDCIEECGQVDFRSQHYVNDALSRALAKFEYCGRKPTKTIQTPEELLFEARFGKPHLKFICNHELALYISIEHGHLDLDFNKAEIEDYETNSYVICNMCRLLLNFTIRDQIAQEAVGQSRCCLPTAVHAKLHEGSRRHQSGHEAGPSCHAQPLQCVLHAALETIGLTRLEQRQSLLLSPPQLLSAAMSRPLCPST